MGLYEQSDCASKQAFCTLGYQTVTELKNVGLLSSSQITYTAPSTETIISNAAWVRIKQILQNIYNVGSYSSGRLPRYTENGVTYTPNNINNNNIAQYHTIDLNEYNMILKLLKQNSLSDNPYITAARLSLQSIINSFTIEDTRCNYCNLACDITCNTKQCCDSDCNCNCDCNCVACSHCDAAFDSYNGGCGCTYWDNG